MVLPLISRIGVTKGLREALPFITSLVESNPTMSARAILVAARDAGLSFRDGPALNVVAQLKANLDIARRFRGIDFNDVPRDSDFEVAVTPLKKDYSYIVQITGLNPATGERERRTVAIASDNALSPESVLESALDLPRDRPGSQGLINTTYNITHAYISPLAI